MRISMAVNGSSSSMESVLNVGLYFKKMGFNSQCHIKTCLYSLIYIQNRVEAANIVHAYNFVQLHYFQYRRPIFRLYLLDLNVNKRRSIWYPQSVSLHCRYTLRHLEI